MVDMTSKQIHAAIKSNVNDYHEGTIDYETFSEENRRLWDLAGKSERKHRAVTKRVRANAGARVDLGLATIIRPERP